MSNLIQYIKLKLRRTLDTTEKLDEGELALNTSSKELKIGTANEQSWGEATSLNRLRRYNKNNKENEFPIQPGEMVYHDNQLKINTSAEPKPWDEATSLNHMKTHTGGTVTLAPGEFSFDLDTGELLIQGNNKAYAINRIPLMDDNISSNANDNELFYNTSSGCFQIKISGAIRQNETLPIIKFDEIFPITKLVQLMQNNNIYYFVDNQNNPLNGVYVINPSEKNFKSGYYPISNLQYDITDQKLSYKIEDKEEILNKVIIIASSTNTIINENGETITNYTYPQVSYSKGTLLYDTTRQGLLISTTDNMELSQMPFIPASQDSTNQILLDINNSFGDGELI